MAQTIIVDTTPGYRMPTIYYSQGDIGRTFSIDLQSRFGESLPASPTITIQATKPSGLGFSVGSTSISGAVVTFTVTETMSNEAGRFPAELKIVKNSVTLFTANFYIDCEANAHPEGTTDGDIDHIMPKFMSVTTTTLPAGDSATYSFDANTNTATFGIPKGADGSLASQVLAADYSSSKTYAVGDYVYYSGNLYRCTTAITTAEAWTSGHWTQVALADDVSDLKSEISAIEDGYILADIMADYNQQFIMYTAVNTTYGTIGETTNNRYFSTMASAYSALLNGSDKLVVKCDTTYLSRFYCAFFDINDTLIGSVITVNPVSSNLFEINVPQNAVLVNVGGYSTGGTKTQNAIDTTIVYGRIGFFVGKLDTALTSESLPAQGKAVGDRLTSLENLKTTTGLNRLRIIPNSNNINFVVKTGLTNLYLGYGAGGDNTEDTEGETEFEQDNGKYNVAVGYEAFHSNEDGDHCTAIGYTALKNNTTGDFNTCVGEDAMYGNTSGSRNVAMGDHILMSNNGSNNVAIGSSVARTVTNISYCVLIGDNVSIADNKINTIVIGADAAGTKSNQIVIGNENHNEVIIANKKIKFNNDGTVTWEPI